MSKPTKYTPGTTKKLLDAIRGGFTVKSACAMAGVPDMTLSRWRRQHPDFDAEFKKATEEQTWYVRKAIRRAGFRTYERKPDKHPQNQEKALGGQNQQGEMAMYEGLPVRFGCIAEDKPYLPCVNPTNGRVEYLKRKNGYDVQHICDIEVFKRSFPGWYRRIQEQMLALCDKVKSHSWPLLSCLGMEKSNVGDSKTSITANLTQLRVLNRQTFSTDFIVL